MKKLLLFLLLIAALAGAGWWWASRPAADTTGRLVLYGNVDIRQVALAFDGTGRITALSAEEGDPVTAGQVIGQLDTRSLQLQAEQAAAQLEAQRQALLALENGSRPEEIDRSRAQLALAEANAALADLEYDRAVRLQASRSGAVSTQTVDAARTARDAATARTAEAGAALQLAEAGARAEDIAAARARLAAAQASLALLRHQIDQGTLRAPLDAVIRARLLEPGDQASPARPAYALAIERPKWVRIYVREGDLGRIRPGMAATLLTDSAPAQPITGRIGYISSVAEFTPKNVQTEELRTSLVYEVRVIVADQADRLRLGQPVTVTIDSGAAP